MVLRTLVVVVTLAGTAAASPTVAFVGNTHFTAPALRGAMKYAIAAYDDEGMQADELYLAAYYWDRGYAQVHVDNAYDRDNDIITFKIEEGDKFTLGVVTLTGGVPGETIPTQPVRIKQGQLFSRTAIAEDRERLSRVYEDRGYAYCNVLPLTKVDLAKHTIAVTFEVEPGKVSHVEHVTLYNSSSTPDDVVLGEVTLVPGGLFSSTELDTAKQRIQKLAHTDNVVVSIKHGSSDELVDVTVEVSPPD